MKLLAARYGWFVIVGALFGARDMCLGGGNPPETEPVPTDAAADAEPDAS